MALAPLATLDDFETWLGRAVDNMPRAEAILSAASTLIRTHTGRVWVDADGEPEEGVNPVKLQAVQEVTVIVADRVYNNPYGTTQESSGPFSRSVAAWAAQGLALTDEERNMISGTTAGVPGLSSIRVIAPAEASGSRRYDDWWYSELLDADESS